ncbi:MULTISPECIES: DUF4235 domain-containing protein [Kytococcus]|uniref:DUF4235 domain-containing protein n=1 Tax=Kytococcus schroeteri TaxID=138300 RepID=A0A2I1PAD9_9MICO|nr:MULTISPECIES: DUF4235 domain-containing protein [Kytococcus]PKZ41589.1 DUF4235 domain-containing protein [Kytococcus schroeteri]
MNLAYKALATALPIVASVVASKVADGTWKITTGRSAQNPDDPEVGIKEAAAFALLSGAAVGVAKMLANRQASHFYMKNNGMLPPELTKRLGLTEEQSRAKAQAKLASEGNRKDAKKAAAKA